MPSAVIGGAGGNQTSGGVLIISGGLWSGVPHTPVPRAGIQLLADINNSGNLYIAFSGGVTITSGGINTSGLPNMSGYMDGVQLTPGGSYFVPTLLVGVSGAPSIYALADANCSGQARIYWEVM